jgi:hypothetical protein
MKRNRVQPRKVLLNPETESDLLLLTTKSGQPLYLPTTQEEQWRQGRAGIVWGMEVIECDLIDPQYAYVVGPQEYVGVMAIRTELTAETEKSTRDFGDIFLYWEDVGFLVKYAKGIIRIKIQA